MKNIKVIITDDEAPARMALQGMIEEYFPFVQIVEVCKNLPEAIKAINKHKPDIVFMDIEMPGYSGMEIFDFIDTQQINFQLVFVTAYNHYAIQAFELSAMDYLLKPLKIDALERVFKKITSLNTNYALEQKKLEVLQLNSLPAPDKSLVIQTADTIYVLKLANIILLEAKGSYTKIVTETHDAILCSKTLADFEYLEQTQLFFRANRSYIINITKIEKIDKKENIIYLNNNYTAAISQDKKQLLIEKLE
jgi:two-component system LytT family response regulator